MKRVTILAAFVLALFASSVYGATNFNGTISTQAFHGGGGPPDGGGI
jgi:hypothetical protein